VTFHFGPTFVNFLRKNQRIHFFETSGSLTALQKEAIAHFFVILEAILGYGEYFGPSHPVFCDF
jgi:hypothetical protein